ncbi:MAG: hypothetical protein QMD97_03840 [Candidatus Aenigmarchaeota archaeon]|nr:hypothetical protein [Candidatus Aenigmarchaeota archaeon]
MRVSEVSLTDYGENAVSKKANARKVTTTINILGVKKELVSYYQEQNINESRIDGIIKAAEFLESDQETVRSYIKNGILNPERKQSRGRYGFSYSFDRNELKKIKHKNETERLLEKYNRYPGLRYPVHMFLLQHPDCSHFIGDVLGETPTENHIRNAEHIFQTFMGSSDCEVRKFMEMYRLADEKQRDNLARKSKSIIRKFAEYDEREYCVLSSEFHKVGAKTYARTVMRENGRNAIYWMDSDSEIIPAKYARALEGAYSRMKRLSESEIKANKSAVGN